MEGSARLRIQRDSQRVGEAQRNVRKERCVLTRTRGMFQQRRRHPTAGEHRHGRRRYADSRPGRNGDTNSHGVPSRHVDADADAESGERHRYSLDRKRLDLHGRSGRRRLLDGDRFPDDCAVERDHGDVHTFRQRSGSGALTGAFLLAFRARYSARVPGAGCRTPAAFFSSSRTRSSTGGRNSAPHRWTSTLGGAAFPPRLLLVSTPCPSVLPPPPARSLA